MLSFGGLSSLHRGYYTESFFAERDIRHIAINNGAMFFDYIVAFQKAILKQYFEETEKATKRIAELDRIFKRIYRDANPALTQFQPRADGISARRPLTRRNEPCEKSISC